MKKRSALFLSITFSLFIFLFLTISPPFTSAQESKNDQDVNRIINKDHRSFRRLSTLQKAEYLFGVSGEKRHEYLKGLSQKEKRKILKKYPGLFYKPHPEKKEGLPKTKKLKGQNKAELVSTIEKIMSGGHPEDISWGLRQYGYSFFNKSTPSFTPLRNVPVSPDYVMGPGDEVEILMWGRLDEAFISVIDSEGALYLPKIGSLAVAGLTFFELKKLIKRKVEAITGVNANVSMGRLRTIDVFIVGEAKQPATYAISSLSTVISALYAAGGPSKNGSLRGITISRSGAVVATLDLYDFFIRGMKNNDIRLQTGDTIFIPVLGPVVGVSGAVRRPAIYEMKGEQNLGELIELAGGILPTGELQNVAVERVEGHRRRVIKSFSLSSSFYPSDDENLKMLLRDFDVIKIYPVWGRVSQVVYLEGHVKYPRAYELKSGMRLRDIIPSYNSLLPEPFLPQAEIIRLMTPDGHPEIVEFNLGAFLAGNESENRLLEDQDRIIIYDTWEKKDIPEVSISGAVRNPGEYRLYKGMTIKDLIFQAGNLTSNAYGEKATLTRVVPGATDTKNIDLDFSPKKAMAGLAPDNMTLKENDLIQIRNIPQYEQVVEQKVFLEGEFMFPGEYAFSKGDKLSLVIEKAGGLTEHAYPFGAMFSREYVKKNQEKRLNEYLSKLEEDVLSLGSHGSDLGIDEDQSEIFKQRLGTQKQLIEKLKNIRVTGRMVIDLPEIIDDPSSSANFELRSGDRLVVEKRPDSVTLMGEVYNPTAVLVKRNMTVKYYLNLVGGITPEADRKRMYVVKANGSVISKSQETLFGMASWDSCNRRWTIGFESIRLDPGDTIIVPKRMQASNWLKLTRDITQILYELGVGAAVLVDAFD